MSYKQRLIQQYRAARTNAYGVTLIGLAITLTASVKDDSGSFLSGLMFMAIGATYASTALRLSNELERYKSK